MNASINKDNIVRLCKTDVEKIREIECPIALKAKMETEYLEHRSTLISKLIELCKL